MLLISYYELLKLTDLMQGTYINNGMEYALINSVFVYFYRYNTYGHNYANIVLSKTGIQ